jgi:hypothetical protein
MPPHSVRGMIELFLPQIMDFLKKSMQLEIVPKDELLSPDGEYSHTEYTVQIKVKDEVIASAKFDAIRPAR